MTTEVADPNPEPAQRPADETVDRRVVAVRRILLHLGLGVWTTPLVGWLLVGGRALQARRLRRWLLPGGLVLACFLLGPFLALVAPWPRHPVTWMILILWGLGGAANAWGERRAQVVPRAAEAAGSTGRARSLAAQVGLWTLGVTFAWGVYGFFLVGTVSPWGEAELLKPFFSRTWLWLVIVALVPLGLGIGLVQALLRRPLRLSAPVVFCWSSLVLLFSVALLTALYQWILVDVAKLENRTAGGILAQAPWPWAWTAILLLVVVPFLTGSVYLAEATGLRDFLRRGVTAAGLGLVMVMNLELLNHNRVLDDRRQRAVEAAEAGESREAARHWRWMVHRLGSDPGAVDAATRGAREALWAGDAVLARRLLESIRDNPSAHFSVASARERAETLLQGLPAGDSESGDLGLVHAVEVAPVRRESYLSTSFSTLLTAIRAARPELGETALKLRLLDLSRSSEEIVLEDPKTVRDLQARARFFDTELVAFPFALRDEALRRGLPVMFVDPWSSGLELLYWSHPASGAVLALDFDLWEEPDRDWLERSEVEQLVAGDEEVERDAQRVRVRISRLEAASLLEEALEREGGWALAVVTPETRDEMLTALQTRRETLDEVMALEAAWDLFFQGAVRRALEQLARRPADDLADDPADELLAVMWLDPENRALMDPVWHERARRAHDRLLGPRGLDLASREALDALSAWAHRTAALGAPDSAACRYLEAVARARAERGGHGAFVGRWDLLVLAVEEGRAVDAVERARQIWRPSSEDADSLRIAETLATLPGAESQPAVRELLEEIRARIGLVAELDEGLRFRRWLPEHWAMQAVLATDLQARRRAWKRAGELDPRNAAYFERWADAEAAAGHDETAEQARARARALTPRNACQAPQALAEVAEVAGVAEVAK